MSKTGDITDSHPPKVCPACGEEFAKPSTYSRKQWASKTYCSNLCRASTLRKPSIRHGGYMFVWVVDEKIRRSHLVAEIMLGRDLEPGEVVHHVNGDKLDDRPENLRVFASNGEHMAEHWAERPWHIQLAAARAARW